MTSLEGVPFRVVVGADLAILVSAGTRSCPLPTLVNGTLMARRQSISSVGHLLAASDGCYPSSEALRDG
jgi:hypothetical protein